MVSSDHCVGKDYVWYVEFEYKVLEIKIKVDLHIHAEVDAFVLF